MLTTFCAAQSILGAVQGLTVVAPDLGLGAIVGITCAILVFLFVIQPFGVAKLGSVFAPVVIIWLLLNFSFGVYVSWPAPLISLQSSALTYVELGRP